MHTSEGGILLQTPALLLGRYARKQWEKITNT